MKLCPVKSLRFRYILGLSVIALLVTGSWLTLRHLVRKQENFAKIVGLSSCQSAPEALREFLDTRERGGLRVV